MEKVLIVCLYATEADPQISLSLAKALIKLNYDVYALLEKSIANKKEWLEILPETSIEYVNIEHVSKWRNNELKLLNAFRCFIIPKRVLLPRFKGVKFSFVFYTFFHHWNDIFVKKIQSDRNILMLHDPIPHSGENKKRFRIQYQQVQKMSDIVVLSKSFVNVVVDKYHFPPSHIYHMKHGKMDHSKIDEENMSVTIDPYLPVNFLFFGRITEYKGIQILLNAFNILLDNCSNIQLTIAGKGKTDEYTELMKRAGDKLILHNRYITDEEVGGFFLTPNTVVVLPYTDATQSGVIPIAARYGNPIIASDTGGLREQLDDGEVGIFVEPGNIQDLACTMRRIIEDPKLREEQSNLMKKLYQSLDWNTIIEKLMIDLKST